jgi:hypothetical protein
MLINSRQQAGTLHGPVLGGYLQLTATSPEPGRGQPEQIPEPDHSSIGPHMAYAVQWWLFAAAVPVGWVVLVRRERRDRLAAAATGPAAGTAGSAEADEVAGRARTEGAVEGEGTGAQAGPSTAPVRHPSASG